MRNYFTLGGVDSRNFGLYINGSAVFDSPARSIDYLAVPGRNGDLIGLSTRLANGTLTYEEAFICSNFQTNLAALRAFLLSQTGYRRLVDTYNPGEYRMVTFEGPLSVQPTARLNAGKFSLTFTAMPQRFLLTGDEVTTLTATGTLNNPTLFPAQPLMRVYGKGNLGVNSETITIVSTYPNSYIDIDCQTMTAYYGASNCNGYVLVSGIDFPALQAGDNAIALGTGITKVEITPRWWTV